MGIDHLSVQYYNFMNRDMYLWIEMDVCLFHPKAWVTLHRGRCRWERWVVVSVPNITNLEITVDRGNISKSPIKSESQTPLDICFKTTPPHFHVHRSLFPLTFFCMYLLCCYSQYGLAVGSSWVACNPESPNATWCFVNVLQLWHIINRYRSVVAQ